VTATAAPPAGAACVEACVERNMMRAVAAELIRRDCEQACAAAPPAR
jgi:hypothetical protein